MNAERLIRMVIRMALRPLINRGINAGINAATKRRAAGKANNPQAGKPAPDALHGARAAETTKRARQAARLARRMGRF